MSLLKIGRHIPIVPRHESDVNDGCILLPTDLSLHEACTRASAYALTEAMPSAAPASSVKIIFTSPPFHNPPEEPDTASL
jgi:hypothetical protein